MDVLIASDPAEFGFALVRSSVGSAVGLRAVANCQCLREAYMGETIVAVSARSFCFVYVGA
jgi:hypothetical protein